jgi:hypothetical protein
MSARIPPKWATYSSFLGESIVPYGPMMVLPPHAIPKGGLFVPLLTAGGLLYVSGLTGLIFSKQSEGSSLTDRMFAIDTPAVWLLLLATASGLIGTFASAYWVLSTQSPANFSEQLSRIDAIYFAVTTFTTTGFGDVIPTSQSARALVTGQMAAGFLLITFAFGIAVSRMGKRRP